ncbi:MAG: hypothetical protein B6I24_01980 [Bacteroidetes bacterium 4572_128]|nr:MAG: hypothetical protein B6I24_01980 [Bacteroidetes bacterium 4572_128]
MKKYIIYFFFSFISINLFSQKDSLDFYLNMSLEELMQIEIITASKNLQKATDAPATVYVVTEEQINERCYSCLGDLLEDIPQVEIQRKVHSETFDIFTFNGITGNEKFLILMDGIRINSATGTPHTIGESYSLTNVKQVEIILGPASSLYGADAFTGIVNIITKKSYENKGFHLNASYGMFNTSNTSLTFATGDENISFSITGKYYHSDEAFYPKYYKKEYDWYINHYKPHGDIIIFGDTVNVPIKDWEIPTNSYFIHSKLNIKNFEIGYSRNYESHSTSKSSNPETAILSEDVIYNTHVESIYALYDFYSDNEKFNLKSIISAQEFKIHPESKFLNQYTAIKDGFKYEKNNYLRIEEQLSYNFSKDIFLLGGISYENINALPKTSDLPFQFDENQATNLQNIYYPGTNILDKDSNDLTIYQDFYSINYKNYGSYLQLQSNFENLKITLGARYDYNTRYGKTINPRIGFVKHFSERLTVKLLFGKAYLAPSPHKSHQHYGALSEIKDSITNEIIGLKATFLHLPNPNLKPEKRTSYEASFLYKINKELALSSNLYYGIIKNLIEPEGFFGETFHNVPVGYVERAVNKGEAETYGGTFRIDYRKNFSKLLINFFSSYTYSDGEILSDNENEPLKFNAKNTVKTGLGINFKKIVLFTKLLYRTKSHHRNSTYKNPITNDEFIYLNLSIKYNLLKKDNINIAFFTKFTNLLNSKIYHVGDSDFNKIPQEPLKISFGFNLDF